MDIGQKVVCVKGAVAKDGSKLLTGEIYPVLDIVECECGAVGIYVGLTTRGFTRCLCGVIHPRWIHNINRFRPIDYEFGEKVCEQFEPELCGI